MAFVFKASSLDMSAPNHIPSDVRPQLTEDELSLIRATAPILAIHGTTITRHFYSTMIAENSVLRDLFSFSAQETGHQADALAGALYAYATHIDNLTPIVPVVTRIANKHAGLGVAPEHYAIVGAYLLKSIKDILGDAFTDPIKNAWYQAYWQLAKIFIDAEAALYQSAQWTGFRDFKVAKRVNESDEIASFHLAPVDESLLPLAGYRPGQFLTVRMYVDKLECFQNRHYSLSDAPSTDHFRISVKREAGLPVISHGGSLNTAAAAHPGWLSNLLHETAQEGSIVQCAFPFGDFYLDNGSVPVVLISAGVGITPMLAMFNTLAKGKGEDGKREVTWIHGARGKSQHAFGQHVRSVVNDSNGRIKSVVFYSGSKGSEVGVQGQDFDIHGRIDLDRVDRALLHLDSAQFYVCGPDKFMNETSKKLVSLGAPLDRVHMEAFGSGGVQA